MSRVFLLVFAFGSFAAFAAGPVGRILPPGHDQTEDGFYAKVEAVDPTSATPWIAFLASVPSRVGDLDLVTCDLAVFDSERHLTLRASLAPRTDHAPGEARFDVTAEPGHASRVELSFLYRNKSGVEREYIIRPSEHFSNAKKT